MSAMDGTIAGGSTYLVKTKICRVLNSVKHCLLQSRDLMLVWTGLTLPEYNGAWEG